MFTNNYINYRKLAFEGDGYWLGNYAYLRTTNNEQVYSFSMNNCYTGDLGYWLTKAQCKTFPVSGISSATNNSCGVFFGSGSTPATKDDYTLEAPITAGLTITNPTKFNCVDEGQGKWVISASYVLTNTTDADIIIWEVGVVTTLYASNTYRPFLMERTVLTEPITIPAGESKLVTYKITFNHTLNVEQ